MTATAPHPAYGPALTAADMPWTFYGVQLSWLGDDLDRVVALGHVGAARMVAAANAMHRDVSIDMNGIFATMRQALDAVEHRWAVRMPVCTFGGDWYDCPQHPRCTRDDEFPWYINFADDVGESTPGAFPITILTQE